MIDVKWALEIERWCASLRERGEAAGRCVGFTRMRKSSVAWRQCKKSAMDGEVLCAGHRDALNGVVLGILQREQAKAEQRARSRGCFPCAGHTRSRGGKADVPCDSARTRRKCVLLPN